MTQSPVFAATAALTVLDTGGGRERSAFWDFVVLFKVLACFFPPFFADWNTLSGWVKYPLLPSSP